MARSYNAEEYQMYLDILRTREYGKEINDWIHNADSKMWCRSLSPIPRFGITTSNPVEILFSALRNWQHYPALDLLLHLETYILYRRFARWNKSQQMKNVNNGSTLQKSTNNLRKLFIIMFNNWFENGCYYYNWN